MRAYFERFGEVESAMLPLQYKSDRTGNRRHRGFGFVTFASAAVAREVHFNFWVIIWFKIRVCSNVILVSSKYVRR